MFSGLVWASFRLSWGQSSSLFNFDRAAKRNTVVGNGAFSTAALSYTIHSLRSICSKLKTTWCHLMYLDWLLDLYILFWKLNSAHFSLSFQHWSTNICQLCLLICLTESPDWYHSPGLVTQVKNIFPEGRCQILTDLELISRGKRLEHTEIYRRCFHVTVSSESKWTKAWDKQHI